MSSSSSSHSSKEKRKKDKAKKEKKGKKVKKDKSKKDDKKAKKDGKKDAKERQRAEQAKEWFCDRLDAVRYTRQLLEIDHDVATELEVIFESLDEGEVVRIDGLENKQVKKKLRHLMQALKLTAVGESGFKSADKKVSFAALFADCLKRAHEKNAAEGIGVPAVAPQVMIIDEAPARASPQPPAAASLNLRDAGEGECGEEDGAPPEEALPPPKPKKPRLKGPQLPTASIGAVDGGSSEEEKESSDAEDHAGPKTKDKERLGVDLSSLPKGSKRDEWLQDAGKYGGMFDAPGGRPRQADAFQVQRSPAEIAAWEKSMRDRGGSGSLLEQTKEGKFAEQDGKAHVDSMHQKLAASQDMWGQSEKEQDRRHLAPKSGTPGGPTVARRPFNPEEDMQVRKPMAAADFSKFVEEAQGELAGKFCRSQAATSFL